MKIWYYFLILALISLIGVGGYSRLQSYVTQPISFNHKKHTKDLVIDCETCHKYVKKETFAGLPKISDCLQCHENPLSQSKEEEKIRNFQKRGLPIKWERIYKVPSHVYYSHRRHVTLGVIECSACHGPIAETVKPPSRPLNKITMSFCISCHEKKKISNDCSVCHV